MKKIFLLLVPMAVLLLTSVISSADESKDCLDRCDKENAACRAKVGGSEPFTYEEQQKLDECGNIKSDCDSRCAEGNYNPPQEPAKNEPAGDGSGAPESSGR